MAPALGKKIEMVRIAPGISTDHFIPGEKSSTLMQEYALLGKDVIVCVGRLVHRKGQDRLIEAMPEILTSRPNAVLVLVGEGPYKSKLVKLVHSLGIEESVRFIGRVQYSALPAHIQLGDLFAMPSRSRFFGLEVEGLGIVYLEASSCGVPVIAGASGGAPDAVLEGETGVVVNGSDVHAIADTVVNLLNKPELRRQMSERGREWASQEWNWVLWGQRFEKMLLGLN
jgi:phosphatidylinositol alpha-1,6-mannosyltransferase